MQIPIDVSRQEAAALYRFMVYGKPGSRFVEFSDPRNQVIFKCLKHLKDQIGYYGDSESELIRFMEEMEEFYGYLTDAGGKGYVNKVFGGYESPVRVLLHN